MARVSGDDALALLGVLEPLGSLPLTVLWRAALVRRLHRPRRPQLTLQER